MKKLVVICLIFVLTVYMSISAFAATGGFVSSPSGNPAPELVVGKNETDGCEAELIITAYGRRDRLSVDARQKIEEAYSIIIGTEDLTSLNKDIGTIAKDLGVSASSLAVSDLFDISSTDCDDHANHGHFDITLKSDTLKNFVCLLHYYNGEWSVVESAEVTHNGEYPEFDADEFSPFAIVVSSEEVDTPPAPNNTKKIIAITASVVAAALVVTGTVVFLVFKFKKKEETI